MAVTFKGFPVTILRPATAEEQGAVEQALVRFSDGTEGLVHKNELMDSDAPAKEAKTKPVPQRNVVARVPRAKTKNKAYVMRHR